MSRNFLALCRDVVSDLGIAGGLLQSVQNLQSQEQVRVCNWVARADLYLQLLWADWTFLRYSDTAMVAAAGDDFVAPQPPVWADSIISYDLNSLWMNPGQATAQHIAWLAWPAFQDLYQRKPKTAQARPSFFSVDPTGKLWLSHIMLDMTFFSGEYHVIGRRMLNDNDTSPIPEAFDSLICERAKIIYAGRENAQEILTSASAEYADQLDKMQAYCLPDNLSGRTSRNDRTTIPPSYVE